MKRLTPSQTANLLLDIHEDEEIDEVAFKALIRAAIALNESSTR